MTEPADIDAGLIAEHVRWLVAALTATAEPVGDDTAAENLDSQADPAVVSPEFFTAAVLLAHFLTGWVTYQTEDQDVHRVLQGVGAWAAGLPG